MMGKFANSPDEFYRAELKAWHEGGCEGPEPEMSLQGAYLGPRPRDLNQDGMYHGKSGFDALGLPVPFFRRSAGIRHLRDMGFTDRRQMDEIVGKMSARIERDDSHGALEEAMRLGVDATGCYRMLSVLLCEPPPAPPKEPEGPPVSFVDLVEA
jgi:hypothetical protein